MTQRSALAAKNIVEELRKKKLSPREVVERLGLDKKVLDVPRMALDGANPMKPTRLEYLAVTRTAAGLNPLLAADKRIEYGPIFTGLNRSNIAARKPEILTKLTAALKGNTVAQDATIEHVAKMLDHLEHTEEPKFDESVNGPQHRAMEAAAHGHSTLDIPQSVGKEFADADKGKTFRDALPEWLRGKGVGEDTIKDCMDWMGEFDEMPDNALDESEEEKKAREEKEAADKAAKDAAEAEGKKGEGAMDTKSKAITQDQLDKAIASAVASERKNAQASMEAREFVRPFVGELPMALDSADKILRAACKAKNIEIDDDMPVSAMRTLIKHCAKPLGAQDQRQRFEIASDAVSSKSSGDRWGSIADRIRVA